MYMYMYMLMMYIALSIPSEGQVLTNRELETFMEEVAKLVLQDMMMSLDAQPSDVIQLSTC